MKQKLKLIKTELFYFDKNKNKIEGKNPSMRGYCTGLSGDCTGLRGYCTGLSGDCTGLSGDIDSCELTEEERKKGIDIQNLREK
jgi:hypothetical protein